MNSIAIIQIHVIRTAGATTATATAARARAIEQEDDDASEDVIMWPTFGLQSRVTVATQFPYLGLTNIYIYIYNCHPGSGRLRAHGSEARAPGNI